MDLRTWHHSVLAALCIATIARGQSGTFSKDDTSGAPWQVLMSGSTNPNLQLITGVNTSASPFGSILAFKQSVGPLPLVLQGVGGNVGIGTTSPLAKLDVSGVLRLDNGVDQSGYFSTFSARYDASHPLSIAVENNTGGNPLEVIGVYSPGGGGAVNLTLGLNGSVGIGTTTPGTATAVVGERLDLENAYLRVGHPSGPFINFYQPTAGTDLKFTRIGSIGGDMYIQSINDAYSIPQTRIFVQNTTGNVGIGTAAPTQKLSVNGTVRAKEVVVETTGWSDYVFAKGYKLESLPDVEKHIQKEGHLPGIPSADEIERSGIGLGEMQAKLLAKIEELTLHQIALEKKIEAKDAKITALQARVASLEAVR